MYSKFNIVTKYIRYFLTASNGKGHGIHSPFVYDFIKKVMNDNRHYYYYGYIEDLRNELKLNTQFITVEDFGAGSKTTSDSRRTIASIAHAALKPAKFGQLLFRMVNYFQPKNILELGTSLGITTAYIASAKQDAKVVTLEGAKSIAAIARKNFETLAIKNIELVTGNFDNTLSSVLRKLQPVDFAFIDGNHRKEPALNYFNQLINHSTESTVLIFDDIHWSEEMEEAWKLIKQTPQVTLTIDLFFIGIVFFRHQQKEKQHFTIRF